MALVRVLVQSIMVIGMAWLVLSRLHTSQADGGGIAQPFFDYYWAHQGERVLGKINSPLIEHQGYQVQYFEKGCLEDHSHETASPARKIRPCPLTVELLKTHAAAPIDGLPLTYGDLYSYMAHRPPPEGYEKGTTTMTPEGVFVPNHPDLEVVPGFIVPPPFWNYINRIHLFPGGWQHDVGLPLTHAFEVAVETAEGGRTITLQAFERAILSYDPADVYGWPVKRLNIGTDAMWLRGMVPMFKTPDPLPPWPREKKGPKRIEVRLGEQWIHAYEGDYLVMTMPISTGKDGFETPPGSFTIYRKIPQKRLQGHDRETGESWDIPDVPSIMFYYGSVAIHGVYWHNRFGTGERHSHGCVGLAPDDAATLYDWAERGIPVIVY